MIDALMWTLAGVTAVPFLAYTSEVVAGLPRPTRFTPPLAAGIRVAVLVPAHNEQAGIARTVAGLIAAAPAGTRVLVVADNCSDDTAAEARRAGAEAIERHDLTQRGKGYALAFGRDHLAADAPDVVIVVDADCHVLPGTIESLAARAHGSGHAVQSINLIENDLTQPPLVQISGFAMLVKNLVRLRGLSRTGGSILLTGTGMALPWPIFRTAALATGNIVEDMELGIELARRGQNVLLEPGGTVLSPPAHVDDMREQRQRWEFGYFASARRWALPLVGRGLLSGSRAQVALGFHMLVPPLASLFFAGASVVGLLALLALLGFGAGPVLALALLVAIAGGLTVVAWSREGRETLSFAALLAIPRYLLWKVPLYLGGGPKGWVRTRRR